MQITMLEGYSMAKRRKRSGGRKTAQQSKLGRAAKACKGKKGGAFRACVSKKLKSRR
jgi:hypothetical protein